jgi:cell division septation protein DedD
MIQNRLMVIMLTAMLLGACGERGAKRLPLNGFKVAFESNKVAPQMRSGERVVADVTVKNISPVTWPSKPNAKNLQAVNLAYHWLDQKGRMVVFDGERTPLPHDLKPGDSVALKALIQPPEKAGSYILEITLVQEGVAWFPEKGGGKLSIPVEVAAPAPVTTSISGKKSALEVAEKRLDARIPLSKAEKLDVERGQLKGAWTVQIGSYPEKEVAEQSAKKLRDKGYDTYILSGTVNGRLWHKVRVGHLASREEAKKLQESLNAAEGITQTMVASSE